MRLAEDDSAPGQARRYVRGRLNEARVPDEIASDIELVVTELVTNALRHGTPPFEFEVHFGKGTIGGSVHDRSNDPPQTVSEPDERGGFGMNIVTACTSSWGSAPRDDGKQVWFEIELDTFRPTAR